MQTNIAKEKQQSVYQIQTNFEQVLKMVDLSVTNLVTSSDLITTLDEPLTEYQFQLYNQTKRELVQLQRFEAGTDDFLLASLNSNWRINNKGLRRINSEQSDEIKDRYFSLPHKSSWIVENKDEIIFDSNAGNSCEAYISLVKQLPLNSNSITGISIAYIPVCNFSDILTKNLESETVMVLDENHQVIGHSDFNNIGKDFSNEPFISNLNESDEETGQFNIVRDDGDYKVTYRKSNFNHWTYISMIEMNEFNKQTSSIGWFTFIICSIMLIGILILAFISSRKLYKPIRRVVSTLSQSFSNPLEGIGKDNEFDMIEKQIRHILDQNNQLESKLQGQVVQLRQFFIARLLQNKIESSELSSKLTTFNYSQSWKRCSVLSIQIDSLEDSRYNPSDEDLLLFTINTMMAEHIPINERLTPIVVNKTQVTIYLSNHEMENEYKDTITSITKTIQSKIEKELNLSISVGISDIYTELSQTHQAFKESLEALRYTLKFGPSSIIFFEDLKHESSFYTVYPKQIENELFDAIKIGDKESVDLHLEKLVASLFTEKLTQTQYEIAIVRFLTNLLELTETLGVEVLEFDKHNSLFDQLYEFRTLPEVVNWFKNAIIYPIISKVDERTKSQYKNISDEIIHIVQQEYDSELTLNYIAEKLHYNPNYLSSIFRKETNTSFSDYLSLFRLKKAKEWLLETDMTVKEIAEKLNYNNSQNFIRSFRKIEGTTPGRYRKNKQS